MSLVFIVLLVCALLVVAVTMSVLYGATEKELQSERSDSYSVFECKSPSGQQSVDSAQRANLHLSLRSEFMYQWRSELESSSSELRPYVVMAGGSSVSKYDTDTELFFIQESNFLYLSGLAEPDCALLLDVVSGTETLYVPKRDALYAVWNGKVLTTDDYVRDYRADSAVYIDDMAASLRNVIAGVANARIFTLPGAKLGNGTLPDGVPRDSSALLGRLYEARSVKLSAEIDVMRAAARVSADAHRAVMRLARPHLFEYTVQARFEQYCQSCALTYQSYMPIVGTGYNGAILHYVKNDAELLDGQMLLIDAAGAYLGYTSDVTRTWPVNGRFAPAQRTVYNMVLRVQERGIGATVVGASWHNVSEAARRDLLDELADHDFVSGSIDAMLADRVDKLFMNHGLGHFVGLDVHDTTSSPITPLRAGMVLTVEPGIYFNEALLVPAFTDPKYQGYLQRDNIQPYLDSKFGGVRIEDVVLVTNDGNEVMSIDAPRDIASIERLMSQNALIYN
jgi:Xaa-Pro dipeptidase